MDADAQIRQLQAALHETQEELRSVPWLIGALRRIASYDCEHYDEDVSGCDCRPCTARYALYKYKTRTPIPRF